MKPLLLALLAIPALVLGQRELSPALQSKAERIEAEVSKPAQQKLEKASWQIWPKFSSYRTTDDLVAASKSIVHGAYPNVSGLSDSDILALCMIVMMDAAQDAEADLKAIMDGVQQINKLKKELRQDLQALHGSRTSSSGHRFDFDNLKITSRTGLVYYRVPKLPPFPHSSEGLTLAQLDADVASINSELDSMNELGETESLRLQMAMDRKSKLIEALSNILKKISDTDSQILQNLKG